MTRRYIDLQVMDRHDLGQTAAAIARELGMKRTRVDNIVQRYAVNTYAEARALDALRAQTEKLGQLVRDAGGHR